MALFINTIRKHNIGNPFLNKYVKFRSSIYGRVVYSITILSLILFVSFGVIFRSVNEEYMKTVIRQSGNNIGYLVEGSLYKSMLDNDKSALQSTLDIINTMPGIDEVNMYDNQNNLAYTSFSSDTNNHSNPDCISCHADMESMFPKKEKAYRIIDVKSECSMTQNDNSHRHLLIRSPILNEKSCYTSSCHAHKQSDEVLGSLVIKIPLKDLDSAVSKSSTEFYLLATLTTLLLIGFLIFFTSKVIKKPLNAIVKASQAVSNGDKNTRLEIKPNQLDDMRMVSLAFNEMLDNLQSATNELHNWSQQLEYKVQKKTEELGAAQSELIHIERIASLGKLSLSVAHEINNPLSGILIYTKLVQKQLTNQNLDPVKKESMLKQLMLIETETKRCGNIVKGLLDFSRKDQDDYEPKHLHEILQETFDLMTHQMKIANINFSTEFKAKSDLIYCSPNQIKQACIAILVNASDAVTENGAVLIRTKDIDEDRIRLEIVDNGIGIPAEDIPHIFEPFFSTKRNSRGQGLGLAIVHGIIQSHKGKIDVKSELGKGTTISISLPLIKT
ncbi:MAG: HAMP domain-containing protein [Bacteroidales bacterium]|nr:HAMP domain-containing protein [Bacteroidales bacterium]